MGESVVLFGDINIDVLMSITEYPPPSGDAMASQVNLRLGGSVTNTAIVLAKLNTHTRLIGRTGDDLWADLALQPLVELGVDIHAVQRDKQDSTGLIFIPVTAEGERTMFSYRGANTRTPPAAITSQLLQDAGLLHISSYNFLVSPQKEATWHALQIARQAGIPVSMDVGVEPSRKATRDLIQVCTPVLSEAQGPVLSEAQGPVLSEAQGPVLSEAEGMGLTWLILGPDEAHNLLGTPAKAGAVPPGRMVADLLALGVQNVGYKLGRQGCVVANREQYHHLPAFPVTTVDTTGAGDAFCAGLIYASLHDLSLEAAGTLANALGALATTVWGGGPALPGASKVLEYLHGVKEYHGTSALTEVLQSLENQLDEVNKPNAKS